MCQGIGAIDGGALDHGLPASSCCRPLRERRQVSRVNLTDAALAEAELDRALATGNAENIARSAMFHVWPLYSMHAPKLRDAVLALPSSVVERYPALRVVHPITPVLARTTRPYKPLVYSDDVRSMDPEEVDFLILTQMIAFRFSGDVAAALVYAKRLEDRILNTPVEVRDRLDGPLWFFHHQIGSTLLAAGDSTRALLEFATSRQLAAFAIQPDAERLALGRIALTHALRGALGDATHALEEAERCPQPTAAHINSSRSSEQTAAALIAVDRMTDDLDDHLERLEPYDTIELTWPFALLARTRAFLARQQPEDALEAIRLATDSHPAQHGSFGSDVIAATSIKALLATGDITRARRISEERAQTGMLTRLATVRLALHEGRLEVATQLLADLTRDETLGPAQRAEHVLLSGWLELARVYEIGPETALQISRVARRRDSRRLLAIMPRQLVDHVKGQLSADSVAEFDAATAGLANSDMHARPALTTSELRLLHTLPVHHTVAMIASTLHVSPNTVKSQLRTLYRKLGCSTRDGAIKAAMRLRLLAPDVR